jgi:hypothetical protein
MDHRQLLAALVDDQLAMAVLHDRRDWDLLPDCDAACGHGASDAPKLLALCEGVLLTLTSTPATDEEPEQISVQVEPLDPSYGRVSLEQRHTDGHISIRRRTWTIRVNASAEPLKFETKQHRGAGFPDELRPSPAESLARALARRLGYHIADD